MQNMAKMMMMTFVKISLMKLKTVLTYMNIQENKILHLNCVNFFGSSKKVISCSSGKRNVKIWIAFPKSPRFSLTSPLSQLREKSSRPVFTMYGEPCMAVSFIDGGNWKTRRKPQGGCMGAGVAVIEW
jgi:hypothetical protein